MSQEIIKTVNGYPVHWCELTPEHFVDKTTLIMGASNSGKTTLIEDILYITKDYIPNYLVIAPATSTNSYKGKLPDCCIKEDLTKKLIQQIWYRQYNVTQIYNKTQDINILESIFNKLNDTKSIAAIKLIQIATQNAMRRTKEISDIAIKTQKKNEIEQLCVERIKQHYKKSIREYRDSLLEGNNDLSVEEITVVKFLDINPRLMLIIDDCSDKFKSWMGLFKKNEENPFHSIFFRGRWNYITLVFGVHDDKIVDTELRKNAMIIFYMAKRMFITAIEKKSAGFTQREKKLAMDVAEAIFGDGDESDSKNYKKICCVRDDIHTFRYTVAKLHVAGFELGSWAFRELNNRMPRQVHDLSNNPFVQHNENKKRPIVSTHNFISRKNKY